MRQAVRRGAEGIRNAKGFYRYTRRSARDWEKAWVDFTFDLHHINDLTPDSPLIISTTPSPEFSTWRYSHWLWVGEEIWVYAEAEKPNGAHEIRLFRLKK